ncbi:MAG: DNRLRE domain-containing protein [Planctomycetaceae bacterium]|nr:DNRLRE domain-containing protein [Planctomycetaceae bacterium]
MKRILVLTTLLLMMGTMAHSAATVTLGSDADTFVRDDVVRGTFGYMDCRGGTLDFAGYLRFNLSGLGGIRITEAQLTLAVSGGASRNDNITTGRFSLHGLNNVEGNTPQNWDEANLTETGTDRVGAEWTGTVPLNVTNGRVTNLDGGEADVTETVPTAGVGTLAQVSGPDLVNFLQQRIYDGGLATFIVTNEDSGDKGYGLGTKENTTETYRPQLTITYERIQKAYLPSPADQSVVASYTNQLSWRNPDPNNPAQPTITSDVYLGTDPNTWAKIADDTLLESAAIPFALAAPAKYYWRVDITDPNAGLRTGDIWSFDTSSAPEIAANPADVAVFGGDAAFAAGFTTTSAVISNKWYKDGAPDVELLDSDPNVTIGLTYDAGTHVYTSTLTLSGVTTADEGLYYCALANSGGTTNSAAGKLIVKRMIAHWQFENDAADETGNYSGTLAGSPSFAAGKVGQAMTFDGVDDYIDLPDGFADFSAGMSITVWANPTAAANWGRFIDFGNFNTDPTPLQINNILFTRVGTTNTLRFDTASGTPNLFEVADAFTQNEWQMFVVTMSETGAVTIYKNGLSIGTGTVGIPAVVTRTFNYIGESNWSTATPPDAKYAGMMDDLRVYNHPISAIDVANLYSDVNGPYCLTRPIYDYNNDCLVSLPDLVYMAGYWLDCGFYPVTDCR